MDSFWKDFGLEDNPYDSRPLVISKNDRKLFVGRKDELVALNTLVSSPKGGIVIVEGEVGVGKTSFVNIFQYEKWTKSKFLPSFEKVELEENINPTHFMLSVFSNMIHNLERVEEENGDGASKLKKYEIHQKAKSLVARNIQTAWAGEVTIMGTGGGLSREKKTTEPLAVLLPSILSVMNEWTNFVTSKMGYSAIFVPVNNLDMISDDTIIEFLNRLRDTLIDRPAVWWILIGKPGLFSLLEAKAHRVSEIVTGGPIMLKSLTLEKIHELIDVRLDNLKISKKVRPIVPNEVVDILYEVSKGEARYILKRISDIIFRFKTKFPTEKEIPLQVAKEMLIEMAKQRIDDTKISKNEIEKLEKMASKGKFQTKDYGNFNLKTAQALQYFVNKFSKLGLVTREESAGKAVFYRTTGDVNMLFGKQMK